MTRLRARGHEVIELEAPTLDLARMACSAAVADGIDVLAVAGGDGVVSMATDLCAGTSTAVAILPAGTGNDNARSLGIPLRPEGALRVLTDGHRRRVDTIAVGEREPGRAQRRVLGSIAAALDARINARATRFPRRLGAANYTLAALVEIALLARTEPLHYRLAVDESPPEDLPALVVTLANMPIFGGGLTIAPDADPTDGLLDLVVIEPVSPAQGLALLRAVRAGRHTRHPAVRTRRVRSVHLDGPPSLVAHGDGEALTLLPLTAQVDPASLDVIIAPLT